MIFLRPPGVGKTYLGRHGISTHPNSAETEAAPCQGESAPEPRCRVRSTVAGLFSAIDERNRINLDQIVGG